MTGPRILPPCHECGRRWIVTSTSSACPPCLDDTPTDPATLTALDAADPDTTSTRPEAGP